MIWENGSRHHRKLRSRGGADDASNVVLMCGSGTTGCHGWVHAHPTAATVDGFMVPSGMDPASVPIRHALHGLVRIDGEGGVHPVASRTGRNMWDVPLKSDVPRP